MNRSRHRCGENHSSPVSPLDNNNYTIEAQIEDCKRGENDLSSTDDDEKETEKDSDQDTENDDVEDTFISVGVDFGTTYSGVAWSLSTSPKDVHIVSSWEGEEANNYDSEKVPSVVTYNSQGKITSWGFSLEEKRHHISWFKLGLCEEATKMLEKERPDRYEKLYKLFKKYRKTPLQVSAEYLRALWTHAMQYIKDRIDPVLWDNIKLKIVLTVPAMWDHKAQSLTRQAAEMAGLLDREGSTLELIAEPEAAALAIFTGMNTSKTQCSMKKGDSFIICDAGGGTVDLISYKIENLEPLTLEMCAEAVGGCCGAVFLDGAFENLIRTFISPQEYNKLGHRALRKMMNDWEFGLKRSFRTNVAEDQTWHVDIPGFRGISEPTNEMSMVSWNSSTLSLYDNYGTLTLGRGHVTAVFSEVCSKIIDLVRMQIVVIEERENKGPAYIFPVGGLGGNRYLKEQLSMRFEDLQLRIPPRPWSAICRGAVLKGLGHDLVVNHVSKYNYGLLHDAPFIEGKHLESEKLFLAYPRIYVALDQMEWFLKKGENVAKDTPVCYDYFSIITKPKHLRKLSAQIYYSQSVEPETRLSSSVKKLCTLDMKFNTSIFDELPVKTNATGDKWREVEFVLEMRVSSGQLNWTVKHQGIERGKIRTWVEYEKPGVPNHTKLESR